MGALSVASDSPFKNMLHSGRLGSFLEGGWPDRANSSFTHLCTAQKLAQAGLEYYAKGQARCVICWTIVKNLEPTSDPWICHSTVSPDCLLIRYGKRSLADDYSVREFAQLLAERRRQQLNMEFERLKGKVDNILRGAIKAVKTKKK